MQPTPDELFRLRQFVAAQEAMETSRFIQRLAARGPAVIRGENLLTATPKITRPEYDWDEFLACLTSLRRIISEKEPAFIHRVAAIVGRYAGDLRPSLVSFKQDIVAIRAGKAMPMVHRMQTPAGDARLNPAQLLDVFINGMVFHNDAEHETAAATIARQDPWSYLFVVTEGFIIPMSNASAWLAKMILLRGWVETPNRAHRQ